MDMRDNMLNIVCCRLLHIVKTMILPYMFRELPVKLLSGYLYMKILRKIDGYHRKKKTLRHWNQHMYSSPW